MAELRVWGTLPDRYADRRVACSTVDARGRIVALLVDPDVPYDQRAPDAAPYDATVVVIDGDELHAVRIHGLDLRFSRIDALGDGFVMADAQCEMPSGPVARTFEELEAEIPHNARTIGGDGETTGTFHAGSDINHLMTDIAGNIWTGYSDEASICALVPLTPSQRVNPPRHRTRVTLTLPGVIRWTSTGDPTWYAHSDRTGPGPNGWVDCYALNVGRDLTWAYPYMGFPLVEIDGNGVRCTRRTPVRSASGVIVAGDTVAFLSSRNRPSIPGHYEITLARNAGGPIESTGSSPLLLPGGSRPRAWARRRVCRDGRLWLQFDDPFTWHVFEL